MNISDLDIDPNMDPAVVEGMLQCMYSTKAMAETFFPEQFRKPFSPIHDPIFDVIDDDSTQYSIVVAPRGLGKTSIILAYMARVILFRQRRFIFYISSSFDKAQLRTEELKRELLTNPLIRSVFPSIKVKNPEVDIPFVKSYWVANDYTAIAPAGDDQNIRGALFRSYRPDLLILDDFEDKLTINNFDVRFRRREWLFGDVVKTLEMGSTTSKIVLIDSAKHPDSTMSNALKIPNARKAVISACDENLHSLAPDFITDEKLKEEKDQAESVGMLHIWIMETMSKFVPLPGIQTFDISTFVPYNEASAEFQAIKSKLVSMVIHDPAKSKEHGMSDSATVGISCDLQNGMIYVRGIEAGKLSPDEQIDTDIRMIQEIDAKTVGIEVSGMNDWAQMPLINRMNDMRLPVQVVPINATGDKDDRIRSLIPYHKYGYIRYNSMCIEKAKMQALDFPGGIKKDILDALAHMVKMFYILGIFIRPLKSDNRDTTIVPVGSKVVTIPQRKKRPNIRVI